MKNFVYKTTCNKVLLTTVLLSLSFVSKAQEAPDFIRFSPLTAQQIEKCEGDLYYVSFSEWGLFANWDQYVFSALQHTVPVKSISVTNYVGRNKYDELTWKKDERRSGTVNYNGDYFYSGRDRMWQYSGFGTTYTPDEKAFMVIDANKRKERIIDNNTYCRSTVVYNRDEKGRVNKATCRFNNSISYIVDYNYKPSTDFITTIKCYNGTGKMVAEIGYDYIVSDGKLLLNRATCKLYEHTPANFFVKETFVYKINYDATTEVNKVEISFEENKGYKKIYKGKIINVSIDRDSEGNIGLCTCEEIKSEEIEYDKDGNIKNRVDYIAKDMKKRVIWGFSYDEHNNWTFMAKEMLWNGEVTRSIIKRNFVFDTPHTH